MFLFDESPLCPDDADRECHWQTGRDRDGDEVEGVYHLRRRFQATKM